MAKFVYPAARRDDSVVDDYHGTKIVDPYRWLEDPDSDETKTFVEAQNAITIPFIEQCQYKRKIHNRVTEMVNYARYSCPAKHGDSYYYTHNTGLQNQSVLYVQDSSHGEPRVFLDPNKLSEDGTIALIGRSFSEDGKYFAYGLSQSGSDWVTIKFKNAPSGEDLTDILVRVKFSCMAWTHDNKGIFYNCYPEQEGKSDGSETTSNLNQKLFYHRLGTSQSDDVLVMEIPENPRWLISAELSDCGNYIILCVRRGCEPTNKLFYVDLKRLDNGIKRNLPYVKLIDNFDAEYEYITNEGRLFTFRTNLNAPKYKLININLDKPGMDDWVSLVDQDVDCPLEWTACANKNLLILCYMRDVKNELYIYNLESGKKLTQLPLDVGTVVGYSGKKKDTEIFYQFLSFLTPGVIYRCDITQPNLKPEIFREIKVKGFDFSQYETKQVFYNSTDGTEVPMFIVHRKGLSLDGSHPTLLYGYGGFNISLTPSFSVSRLVFAQHLHGVLAIPNIRGGGEYGETWHKGGTKKNKQNVFNDFQCAAEYLISQGYTCRTKLIINGGSNGGLLVAACVNQRPELFACAISQVGVMDMLRFHKFTIGHAWTTDYGCSDEVEQFNWLFKYSPLHNIGKPVNGGQYPAMLLLTADHDDRVVPLHSLKYIAQLQDIMSKHPAQTNPLLIRIDTKAGHGAGKPISKSIDEMTDIYCYVVQTLNLQWEDN